MPEFRNAAPLTISADIISTFNYALNFNHIPLIRKLIISNKNEKDIESLCLSIESDCPFLKPGSCIITLAPGINEIEVQSRIDASYLTILTEAV